MTAVPRFRCSLCLLSSLPDCPLASGFHKLVTIRTIRAAMDSTKPQMAIFSGMSNFMSHLIQKAKGNGFLHPPSFIGGSHSGLFTGSASLLHSFCLLKFLRRKDLKTQVRVTYCFQGRSPFRLEAIGTVHGRPGLLDLEERFAFGQYLAQVGHLECLLGAGL